MTTRARFEKWAESSGWNIDRTDEGDYRTASTDAAWGGWMACAVEAENLYSRECIEWARICEYQKRHGCKVGAQECANLIRGWRANNETPNDGGKGLPAQRTGARAMTDETPQDKTEAAGGQSRAGEAGANLTAVLGAGPDRATEGWTWHHGGRKWHYYRNGRAICGGIMLLRHPSEGYELGNDDSQDNCSACRRKKAAENENKAPNKPGNRLADTGDNKHE